MMNSRFTPSRGRAAFVLLAIVFAAALACPAALAAEKPVLNKGDRLVVVGDSITEQKLYSKFIEDYVTVCTPGLDIWTYQLGWSGETAGGFLNRMKRDLLPLKPNVVTLCYGMNDGGYRRYEEAIGQQYRNAMTTIVNDLKAAGAVAVIGSPGCVDLNTYHRPPGDAKDYNETLRRLGEIDRQIAKDAGMPFAVLHAVLYDLMKITEADYGKNYHVRGRDGIHPDQNGHLIMAYAFLKALGFNGRIGTFTVDMEGGATATDGHKVLSAKAGTVEIESRRYPFCFYGDGQSPNSTRSILPYFPFNDDLNRLTLIVRNLKTENAKVAWGKESKHFTREQLAKGINLAAAFLDNPFSDAFKKVDDAVAEKEALETILIKDPKTAVKVSAAARHEALAAAVRAAVVPVKHTISIEEEKQAAGESRP